MVNANQSRSQLGQESEIWIIVLVAALFGIVLLTKASFWITSGIFKGRAVTLHGIGINAWVHLSNLGAVLPAAQRRFAPPTVGFVAVAMVLLIVAGILIWFLFRAFQRITGKTGGNGVNSVSLAKIYSAKAVMAKAHLVRPHAHSLVHSKQNQIIVPDASSHDKTDQEEPDGSAESPAIGDIANRHDVVSDRERLAKELRVPTGSGVYLGRNKKIGHLWASMEDSITVIGPPRQGKSTGIVIPRLFEWPGAAIVTSVRPDVQESTGTERGQGGRPLFVVDPENPSDLPLLRMSLTGGCEDPMVAQRRASMFMSQLSTGGQGDFWTQSAQGLLRVLLHSAALINQPISQVIKWLHSNDLSEPMEIYSYLDGVAAPGWKVSLERIAGMKAKETQEGVTQTLVAALEAFTVPSIVDQFSPKPEEATNIREFLENRGTLYLTAGENIQKAIAPVIVVIITEILEEAKKLARERKRCDPPLLCALDEVANIAPLPNLPEIYSTAGGSGITMLSILQTTAQAKKRWGDDGFHSLWGATTIRIVLGGVTDISTLHDLAALAGTYEETSVTRTSSAQGQSTSFSTAQKDRMRIEEIYSLRPGEAMIFGKGTVPVKVNTGRAPVKHR